MLKRSTLPNDLCYCGHLYRQHRRVWGYKKRCKVADDRFECKCPQFSHRYESEARVDFAAGIAKKAARERKTLDEIRWAEASEMLRCFNSGQKCKCGYRTIYDPPYGKLGCNHEEEKMRTKDDLQELHMSTKVVQAINEELRYHSTLEWRGRADHVDHGLAGQLITLTTYVRKCTEAWTGHAGEIPALHELRKVAAIAIRGLELYGCPRREPHPEHENYVRQSDEDVYKAYEGVSIEKEIDDEIKGAGGIKSLTRAEMLEALDRRHLPPRDDGPDDGSTP